jgi:hypothetical protein
MIRTFITPTESKFNVILDVPDDYLGQELELIVFKKQEGLISEKNNSSIKFSNKYRGIFTKTEGKAFNDFIAKARNEWERDF